MVSVCWLCFAFCVLHLIFFISKYLTGLGRGLGWQLIFLTVCWRPWYNTDNCSTDDMTMVMTTMMTIMIENWIYDYKSDHNIRDLKCNFKRLKSFLVGFSQSRLAVKKGNEGTLVVIAIWIVMRMIPKEDGLDVKNTRVCAWRRASPRISLCRISAVFPSVLYLLFCCISNCAVFSLCFVSCRASLCVCISI